MAGVPVTEQELVAHVFAPVEGPLAEAAERAIRLIWDRFATGFGPVAPIAEHWAPGDVPQPLPRDGSPVVAAVQDRSGHRQAVLRRVDGAFNLSLLSAAAPGSTWASLGKELAWALGWDRSALLGTALLYLGVSEPRPGADAHPLPAGCADLLPPRARRAATDSRLPSRPLGGLTSWELGADDAPGIGDRRFVVLAAPGRERELSSWAWSEGGSAAEPAVVRWLMRPAELRRLVPPGSTPPKEHRPRTVDGEMAPVLGLGVPAQAGSEGGRLTVLTVADEWFPCNGGLSTVNRRLSVALAAAGAEVFALVPAATAVELADATSSGVQLVEARSAPGHTSREVLLRRPPLPPGLVPDVIIGHGRVTGPAARTQAEDHFPGARRVHVVHVEPDQLEWQKQGRTDDTGVRAEQRTELELELARGAALLVAVGPRLHEWLKRDVPAVGGLPPVLRLDPGFDTDTDVVSAPPEGVPLVLAMGRLDDDMVKGLDIAARALGTAARRSPTSARWELLVRGAPDGQSDELRARVRDWIGDHRVQVVVRPFRGEPDVVAKDVRRASLVLMPSRAEAFGMVGLEAVVAGTPLLASAGSGLGMLLREVLPAEQADRIVLPVDDAPERDAEVWAAGISAVLRNRDAAFADARSIRSLMRQARTWDAAARRLLTAAAPGPASPEREVARQYVE